MTASVERMLAMRSIDVEAKDGVHGLAHLAAEEGYIELVHLLCDRGADIEARDNTGCRPLHQAAYHSRLSIMKYLIEERKCRNQCEK